MVDLEDVDLEEEGDVEVDLEVDLVNADFEEERARPRGGRLPSSRRSGRFSS